MQDAALPRSLATLCSLWLGGDTGMRPTAVARTLEVPRYRINTAVGRFAAGGVVDGARQASPWSSDEDGIGEGYLVVRPPSLRYASVRGVSFASLQVMPLDELIEAAPDTTEVDRTLVRATGCGASVPPDLLTTLLERANSAEAWDEYAALGEAAATYVLTNHPEITAAVADSALERAPRVTIPRLLELAVGDERPTNPFPDHPIRRLEGLVARASPPCCPTVGRPTTAELPPKRTGSNARASRTRAENPEGCDTPT